MKISLTLTKLIYRPTVRWAAQNALAGRDRDRRNPEAGRLTRVEVNRMLSHSWSIFDTLALHAPQEQTTGSRMNVLLACLTLAMLQAMIAAGIERDYAIELIADASWKIYERWGAVPRLVSRMRTHNPVERMRMSVNMFLRFPFNPPGYQFTRLLNDRGISLAMTRCPVAEYFQAQGAVDLCLGTWCNLDYGLAEMWGGHLRRTRTLVAGDDHCDFVFLASGGQTAG